MQADVPDAAATRAPVTQAGVPRACPVPAPCECDKVTDAALPAGLFPLRATTRTPKGYLP